MPVFAKELAGVLRSLRTVPAGQIARGAVLFTAPADPLGVLRVERDARDLQSSFHGTPVFRKARSVPGENRGKNRNKPSNSRNTRAE